MMTRIRTGLAGIALAASLALSPASAASGDATTTTYGDAGTGQIVIISQMDTWPYPGEMMLDEVDEDFLLDSFGYGVEVELVDCDEDRTDRRFARSIGMEDAACFTATDGDLSMAVVVAAGEYDINMAMIAAESAVAPDIASVDPDVLEDGFEDGIVDDLPRDWVELDHEEKSL